jgi:hypothetical protein
MKGAMSNIHFVGGEKGGVGKSVVARVLAQRFIDHNVPFAGVDADQTHGVLARFYAEYTQQVSLTAPESADQILDRALGANREVLVDLPGQSAQALRAWLNGADVLRFGSEMGITFTYWHVIDGGFASVSELAQALDFFGGKLRHIVVKNFGRGSDFRAFEQSAARAHLDRLGGCIVEFPELYTASMLAIDHSGLSFWAAIHSAEGERVLRPLDRQRVRLWLERCYAALQAVAPVVEPSAIHAQSNWNPPGDFSNQALMVPEQGFTN